MTHVYSLVEERDGVGGDLLPGFREVRGPEVLVGEQRRRVRAVQGAQPALGVAAGAQPYGHAQAASAHEPVVVVVH